MTEKQKAIAYYLVQRFNVRQIKLITKASKSYIRKVANSIIEVDFTYYTPPVDMEVRATLIRHIVDNAGIPYVPREQRYGYVSLLAALGMEFGDIRSTLKEDLPSFLYMAYYRGTTAWKTFDYEIVGLTHQQFEDLMK